MRKDYLLHIIGEKASYRDIDHGIKFYIRSSSRSDQALLRKLNRRSYFILALATGISAPLFFPIDPVLKWSVFLFDGLIWSFWIHSRFIYLLKKYGIETLSVRKNKVSYRHYLNHPLVAVQLTKSVKELPLQITTDTNSNPRHNSLFPEKKVVTSYLKLFSHKDSCYLVFHPVLREKEELKNILVQHT